MIHLLLVVMHVSCACKVVLVFFPVVDTLNLDRGVRKLEWLLAQRHGHLVEGAGWLVRAQVDREGGLSSAKLPAMKVMDLADVLWICVLHDLFKCFGAYVVWCALHHDVEALAEERECRA